MSTTNSVPESKLIQFYRQLLPAIGYYADDTGMISSAYPGSETDLMPVMLGNKRLVLPTLQHLKEPDWTRRMVFHPMLQNITGGESMVMDRFRDRASGYMGFIIGYMFLTLARLAVRKESHKDLNPDEARYLFPLSEADDGFVQRLEAVIVSKDELHRNNREFVKFNIQKGRLWNGAKRQRVAGAHFRLYEQLIDPEFNRVLAGVSFRIKDVKMLKELFEFVFPEITDVGYIEFGTDLVTAPSMVSLMTVYKQVADRINKMGSDLGNCMVGADIVRIPTDWWHGIEDTTPMATDINAIPIFEGNNSKNKVASEQEKARMAQASVDAAEQIAVHNQANVSTQPAQPIVLGAPSAQPAQMAYAPQVAAPRPGALLGTGAVSPVIPQTVMAQAAVVPVGVAVVPAARLGSSGPAPAATVSAASPVVPHNASGINVVSLPSVSAALEKERAEQQRQAFEKAQREAYERAMNPMASSQQLPQGARMVGNVLYVPQSPDANGVVPQGAMTLDGMLYVPYVQPQMAPGAMVPGATGAFPPGFNFQQLAMTDPAQWPGVSQQLAAMLRANPVMKQTYLQQLMQQNQQMAVVQQQQTAQQVPRYLQQILEEDRQAEINQRQAQFGGAFQAMQGRLGAVPGMIPGMTPQQMMLIQQQQAQMAAMQAAQAGMLGYNYPQAIGGMHGMVNVPGGFTPGGGMRTPGM